MGRLSSAVLVAALFATTGLAISTTSAAGFVSSDKTVSFTLNVPQGNDDELWFTMSGPSSLSWIAIGMGSTKMDNSLIFMAYADATGNNITLSPRLSQSHVEPTYTSSISVAVLPGSGIQFDRMTVNAMCSNCRSWKGGSINVNSTAQPFIYASGPSGHLNTNSLSAGIQRHSSFGAFTMDLTRAVGSKAVPVAVTGDTSGTVQLSDKRDHEFAVALHGCIMILAFVGLLPLGILILRILNSPGWHGINQAASTVIALLGAFIGMYCATMYNRTKHYNSAHQIFGLIILSAMIGQSVLGFLHHRMFTKNMSETRLAPIHVWLGRIVIPAGIANGFLGFPLALNPKLNWLLVALVLVVVLVLSPFALWRLRRGQQERKTAVAVAGGGFGQQSGYQAQPWSAAASRSDIDLTEMNPQSPYLDSHQSRDQPITELEHRHQGDP